MSSGTGGTPVTPHTPTLYIVEPSEPVNALASARGRRLSPSLLEARREYVRPFFEYCAAEGVYPIRYARAACERAGGGYMSRDRLMAIKQGIGLTPDWFIAGVCRELGQPIETVMGHEWVQRHMPDLSPDLTPDLAPDRAS